LSVETGPIYPRENWQAVENGGQNCFPMFFEFN
jgi:hypothetical protein